MDTRVTFFGGPNSGETDATGSDSPSAGDVSDIGQAVARRSRWRKRILILMVLAATGLAGLSIWWYWRPRTKVVYVTAAVTRGEVAPYVTASGTVNPVVTVQVGTYVSGVIQALYCDFNTRVKAGQLCAKIDPRPYQVVVDQDKAAVAAAKAQLVKDQASLAYAKINYDRQVRLVAQDSASRDAADIARSTYKQALAQVGVDRASVLQRQADLEAAQVNLGYTNITSPVDGTVVSRNVTQGQTVAASFQTPTLFLIATDLTHMQVDTNVSESDIGRVRNGNDATFTVAAFPNRVFKGRVVQVRQSPQTIQNVVTYDVIVGVDNPSLQLMPGMTADVRIITGRRSNVLRVPVEALRYWPQSVAKPVETHSSGSRVWVLRDNRPRGVQVEVGLIDDRFAEILKGGLSSGERVIIGERTANPSSGRRAERGNRPRAPFL